MPTRRAPTECRRIEDFINKILVACPVCSKMSTVRSNGLFGTARLSCKLCGYTKSRDIKGYSLVKGEDPYFGLPLWLQAPCSPHTLWAYNSDHLSFLKQYVEATDRRRPIRGPADPLNTLLASRLPRWIQLAKNRNQVLKAIAVIETKLTRPAHKGRQPTTHKTRRG
jgi:hypothetical protein